MERTRIGFDCLEPGGGWGGGWYDDAHGWHPTFDYFWDLIPVAYPFIVTRTVTLSIQDQSVTDQPADRGVFAGIGEAIGGWWHGVLQRKHAEMKADCERKHGPGGCEGTSVKELTDVFTEATVLIGATGVGNVVAGAASKGAIRGSASAGHNAPKPTLTRAVQAKGTEFFEGFRTGTNPQIEQIGRLPSSQ